MSDALYRYEIPECPLDTDGDGDCAMCARQPDFHRRLVEVPTTEVPWCAEHDCPFYSVARFHADGNGCRLEEPARHCVIGEAE
jgi:hypothetical protein